LARNGRDWHHLIDLCALAGALVVRWRAYDPGIVNDRLLLGLKETMSKYGLTARDSKAKRGEFRFMDVRCGGTQIARSEPAAKANRLAYDLNSTLTKSSILLSAPR
jgi:hypothetical protein